MAESSDKLMAFVEAEMKKVPDISSKDLFEKAKAAVPAARDLTVRQFHARYPLQVKRKASLAAQKNRPRRRKVVRRPRSPASSPSSNGQREAVRTALLKFATDLSAAEQRKDLVKVLANVDTYVDQVLKAAAS